MSDSGEPLLFFVQIELQGRHQVVQAVKVYFASLTVLCIEVLNVILIKKNGGKMVGSMSSADYVILAKRSSNLDNLLNQCKLAKKPALRFNFVLDCVERQAILDPDYYVLDKFREMTKGGDQSDRPTASPKKKPRMNVTQKTKPPTAHIHVHESSFYHGPPSPTPPPESAIQQSTKGFLYTEAEREYFFRYAKVLLERDPRISNTQIAFRIHEKVS